MNHCLLEVEVQEEPTVRYTQENNTPIAEMNVLFDGLRSDDPKSIIKVVGWGNIAQEIQKSIKPQQKLLIEGRLRMNTVSRQDGTKEKKAEFTLSKFHFLNSQTIKPEISRNNNNSGAGNLKNSFKKNESQNELMSSSNNVSWDTSPLIPDSDEIPF